MLKLKNIVKKGNMIICDIIPEDSKKTGKMEYDIDKKNVVSFDLPKGYEYCADDVAHARKYLSNVDINNLPKEYTLMWC